MNSLNIFLIIFSLLVLYILKLLFTPLFLINEYERQNNCKLITICDDISESIFSILNTFYTNHVISIEDDLKLQLILDNVSKQNIKRIDIILNTCGGSIESSDTMIKLLLLYDGIINVYIPHRAMSAGTLMALMGDKIYMNKYSILSPTDPQVELTQLDDEMISVSSLINFVETKGIENVADEIGLEYFEYKKLYDENIATLNAICSEKIKKGTLKVDDKKKFFKNISKKFGYGKISHHTSYSRKDLIEMKFPIKCNVPDKIMFIITSIIYLW
jgi:Serine dehydrogenase proteinase